jgi:hypothetical protein
LENVNDEKKLLFELELVEIDRAGKMKKIKLELNSKLEDFCEYLASRATAQSSGGENGVFNLNLKWLNVNNSLRPKTTHHKLINLKTIENENHNHQMSSTLDDCFRLFTQPERLNSENPWYCSKCKKHQEATKQMSLWKLPKYLIITLKRFQATKASDNFFGMNEETSRFMMMNSRFSYLLQNRVVYNKLNTFIDFPIK